MRRVALICAAGVGARSGLSMPKQYLPLGGRTLLEHTVARFTSHDAIDDVVVVVSREDPFIDACDLGRARVLRVGGETRQMSVYQGLQASGWADDVLVMVHDAARPYLSERDLTQCVEVLTQGQAFVLAQPMSDTVKEAHDGVVVKTLDRTRLWRAQTPQGATVGLLKQVLATPQSWITDEASALEGALIPVHVVSALDFNEKVTTPACVAYAQRWFEENKVNMPEFRVGQGYDTHRLVEGRPLMLGGVQIPYEKGLDGHSDADVLLHAITDAVLGAAGLGDIGECFPPSDPRFKGADSRLLLAEIVKRARDKGWVVVNCDATVVAEKPKLSPYKAMMGAQIASLLEVSTEAVNIKAKTNEKMDDVGREVGMMAQAVVLMIKR